MNDKRGLAKGRFREKQARLSGVFALAVLLAIPSLLVEQTSTRVARLHARKFSAQLQAATTSNRPILLLDDTKSGHSGGRPVNKLIEKGSDGKRYVLAVESCCGVKKTGAGVQEFASNRSTINRDTSQSATKGALRILLGPTALQISCWTGLRRGASGGRGACAGVASACWD